jgi:hypothetical protein
MSPALDQPRINTGGWKHYVNDDWFDRPELARDPDLERLAFRLERSAKDKPYALAGNDDLMLALGISRNTLAALLNRYELAGWGRRVLIPGSQGQATGRLGFVLFVRPTNRPVATPASFDQIVKMMHADINRTKGRPRTVPFAPPEPDRPPNPGDRGPQILGTEGPQILGTVLYSKEEGVTAQKTTTTGESSSSFLTPSNQTQDPEQPDRTESLGPVASEPSLADTSIHVEAGAPPSVPELPAELAVHQALLIAIIARFAAGFGKPIDQARTILIGLWGEFRTKAKGRGFAFDVHWLGEALDETEKAKASRKIKESPWVYFRGVLEKYAEQGGPLRGDPTEHQARATLEELASRGWTIVLKSDGTAARGKIRAEACRWEDLPESLRRRIKEQEGPIRALLKARQRASRSWNARC